MDTPQATLRRLVDELEARKRRDERRAEREERRRRRRERIRQWAKRVGVGGAWVTVAVILLRLAAWWFGW